MRTLPLALMGLIVAMIAACRSAAPGESAPSPAIAATLPEIRYYEIADT